ncbi:ABC transporter permease [Vibrio sp. S12_S33]|uniref:ABC transporter permease n=1 Tax=Vibrio sp. S12_S33 TaxID=2720223 RepID=UPI001782AB22|nr:ABC transporter permease [Vibrio sp. S12_S33]MBD1567404.1 ABC transporter permease [Vibrio sp. S12_S33]
MSYNIISKLDRAIVGMLALLAIVIFIFSLISPDNFFQVTTFMSIAYQLPELGLLTLGMFVAILSGGLNLSIITTSNITGLFMAWVFVSLMPTDASIAVQCLWLTIALFGALFIAFLIGILTGYFIAYIGIHPILVTLGVMTLLKGVGIWLTHGAAISGIPDILLSVGSETFFSIPLSLIIFLIISFFLYVFLEKTDVGKYIYMSGSNINATYFSGVNTHKVTIVIYIVSNMLCVFAGLIMMARFNSARMGYGDSYLLLTVLAVILGGADPFGGFGRVLNTVLSLFVLQTISTGLNLMGVSPHFSLAMWGIALIVVLICRYIFNNNNAIKKSNTSVIKDKNNHE